MTTTYDTIIDVIRAKQAGTLREGFCLTIDNGACYAYFPSEEEDGDSQSELQSDKDAAETLEEVLAFLGIKTCRP